MKVVKNFVVLACEVRRDALCTTNTLKVEVKETRGSELVINNG